MRPMNVLFLGTGNASRSIMAEALMNRDPRFFGQVVAYSAGVQPKKKPHPMALQALEASGIPIEGLRSKGWEEFTQPGAPEIDLVITVCPVVAAAALPPLPGDPDVTDWSTRDPAKVRGAEQRRQAFDDKVSHLRVALNFFGAVARRRSDAPNG